MTPAPVVSGVRLQTAAVETLPESVEAVGTVRTETQRLVASKVQGYGREVRARQGDHVEQGRVLVTIDEREFVAGVDRAQAAAEARARTRGSSKVGRRLPMLGGRRRRGL